MELDTVTMSDVIARSIAMHPTLLSERLYAIARIHREAAASMRHDPYAARIACAMACDAATCAADIADDCLDPDRLPLRARIILFGAAAELLLIPMRVQKQIAAR